MKLTKLRKMVDEISVGHDGHGQIYVGMLVSDVRKLVSVAEAATIIIDEAHEETPGYCPLQDALSMLEAE